MGKKNKVLTDWEKRIIEREAAQKLYIDYDHYCYHSHQSPEQYGDWSESWSFNMNGVTLDSGDSWKDSVPLDFEVKEGDRIFLIWAVYSTGDSFGHSSRGSKDVIMAFKTEDLAKKACQVLALPSNEFNSYTVHITSESGKVVPYYRPWCGYFESLDSLEMRSFIVRGAGSAHKMRENG